MKKIKLYGFEDCISSWIKSYLSERSQCVSIDGVYSEMKNIEAGVPQGSILGPLLYIIFTNDLPEILHNHPPLVNENNLEDQSSFFNVHCDSCGGICCFADDSTYTKSGKDPVEIQNDIEGKYKDISEYMSQNKLVLNTDKTHLIIMTSSKKHRTHNDFNIVLNTGSEIIEPIKCEKLLGGYISNDFTWNIHIRDHEKSMFKVLTSKANALSKISSISAFKTRKLIANGIFMSNLRYLIQFWGGCSNYLLDILQVLQNRAARSVTKLSWYTSQKKLLLQCGWLSVRQMIKYYDLILVFKIRNEKKPIYLYNKLSQPSNSYNTRLISENCIRPPNSLRTATAEHSFINREIASWNSLPSDIRTEKSLKIFKTKLKSWVKDSI